MQKRPSIPETSLYGKIFRRNNLFPTYSHHVFSSGVQVSEEWAKVREEQFSKDRSAWLNFRLATYENAAKISSTLTLLKVLDFKQFKNIGAIGDSPFIQSVCISDFLQIQNLDGTPAKFLLTDFESTSVAFGRKLALENVDFIEFDLNSDSLALFEKCQVILMWGVDCVVEDSTLVKLFSFCRENKIKLVVGSINVEKLRFNWKRILGLTAVLNWVLGRDFGKLHAHLRTEKYFKRLAAHNRLPIQTLFSDEIYRVYLLG
jgi:hypothetical protein